MSRASQIILRLSAVRLFVVLVAGLAMFTSNISSAYAQSASCSQLTATLDTLDRNRDYRAVDDNARTARQMQRDVQRSESAYVRDGCNADAKAGRQLTRECRALAREITSGRKDNADLARSVETGNAVAQQREAILQEIARFGCGGGSSARVTRDRGNLFDQLFDALSDGFDGGGGIRGDEFDPYGNYHTVRTLCVRKSDGFYWPISYSTLTDYVQNDADQCYAQCPGVDVDLYYYDNPGQEAEQAINMYGAAYADLPNAFRFRTEFDKAATCKVATAYGNISITQTEGGQSRAVINYNGLTFPLPIRDPRRQAEVTTATIETIDYIDLPLPRRRPAAPGETPKPVPIAPTASSEPQRVVQFGDKRVRIVGPSTPYAPSAAAGT